MGESNPVHGKVLDPETGRSQNGSLNTAPPSPGVSAWPGWESRQFHLPSAQWKIIPKTSGNPEKGLQMGGSIL